jgi:ABC-type bacteriocin/lantibiotic exporter with double-glycine peptidase domain
MKPLKRFKNLILIDKQDIYQIFLYSIIAGLISLSLPLGIQSIINFIQAGKVSTSWMVLVLIVVIGVAFVGLLKIMQFRITENLQQKIFVRSSFEFAYRFPKIKFNQLYNQYPPELANRFFDTLTVQKGVSKLLLDSSGAALQIIFGIILLSLYHAFFIFFGLILLILLFLIFKINFNVGLQTSLKESKYKYKIAHWLQEIARNHLSFKSNTTFDYSIHKNDQLVAEYLKQRESHFNVLLKQFIQLTGFKVVITAGLLLIGGILVINQQMNIGQFVAAEIIILSIITAVEKLFSGLELFYDVLTSLEKLGSVVDLELEESTENKTYVIDQDNITIETQNISFQYPNAEKETLKNITLAIKPKQHTLIDGENGSGKTTLIRLLARIIEPTTGSIFINNTNYRKFTTLIYRSSIGLVTAQETPFEGTILENITCNNPEIKMDKVNEVLDKLKLTEAIKALPKGLDTPISSEGKQINSSTIQKIVLARCIINEPRILFLENPLDKIDEENSKEILDYLSEEQQPWTLVVVSKNNYWKKICKQRIVLEKGALKAE